jgi:hypothetical protein
LTSLTGIDANLIMAAKGRCAGVTRLRWVGTNAAGGQAVSGTESRTALPVEPTRLTIASFANRCAFSGWNIVQQVLTAPVRDRGIAFLHLIGRKPGINGVDCIQAQRQHPLMARLHVAVELKNLRADTLIRIRAALSP